MRTGLPVRAEKTVALDTTAALPNLDFNYLIKSALALSAEVDLNRLMQIRASCATRGLNTYDQEADELLLPRKAYRRKTYR